MRPKRRVVRSSRVQQKKKLKLKRRSLFTLAIFVLVIIGVSLLSRIDALTVSNISIEGNDVIETSVLKNEITSIISGSHIILFPKKSSFFLPARKIKRDLLSEHTRIETITLSRSNFQSIELSITERKGEYLWCGDFIEEDATAETCYYVDAQGTIFAEAPYFSGPIFFKFYTNPDETTEGDLLGSKVLPSELFTQILSMKDFLTNVNIKTQAVSVTEDRLYELFISSNEDSLMQSPKILFNSDNNFEAIFNNLGSALQTEPFATDYKDDLKDLLYIDLRFDNKVLYKFES
ncbi:hypothetical protein COB64_02815 [Candidatus Wolfebacteria bacterium]|nr:MAG: hypothetical protein COB64_02815 [Candidatus Wolfebacteria bacterium]